MSNYIVTDTELTTVAEAIRAKGGTSEALVFPEGFVSAVEGIQAGGGTDNWQYVKGLREGFEGVVLPNSFRLNAPNCTNFNWAFNNTTGVEILELIFAQATDMYGAFRQQTGGVSNLKVVKLSGDLSTCKNYTQMCRYQDSLEKIDGNIDFSSVTGETSTTGVINMFVGCKALVDVRFVPNTLAVKSMAFQNSENLSDGSLVSLANCFVGGVQKTITMHSTLKSRCEEILGTVSTVTDGDTSYDFFTQDDAGTVTLTEFITTTKGWTLA